METVITLVRKRNGWGALVRSGRLSRNDAASPVTTRDLVASERTFLNAMHHLGYGRYEMLRIERGELVLDPQPTTIRHVKFGLAKRESQKESCADFRLKDQVAELFEYVRGIDKGGISVLEVRGGLPFAMQVVQVAAGSRGAQ